MSLLDTSLRMIGRVASTAVSHGRSARVRVDSVEAFEAFSYALSDMLGRDYKSEQEASEIRSAAHEMVIAMDRANDCVVKLESLISRHMPKKTEKPYLSDGDEDCDRKSP